MITLAFAPSSPIIGAVIAGLTSPTYTLAADTPPNARSRQYAVLALGGTQTGVVVHSIGAPFTLTMFLPGTFKSLGQPNPSGIIRAFPRNNFEVLTRKSVNVLANQPVQTMLIRTSISIPAGADTYDQVSVKAAMSCHNGMLWASSQGLTDTTLTGVL